MLADLRLNLERIAQGVSAEWGIYVEFLATGAEIAIEADTSMDTMSVIDVGLIEPYQREPVIACFFNRHHRGIWANLEDAVARMSEKVWEYALNEVG